MSDNISHTTYIGDGKLSMSAGNARKFLKSGHDFAEINFLEELIIPKEAAKDDLFEIIEPWWCGEFSEYSLEYLFEKILPKTTGSADILVVWESGELTGVQVRGGVVTDCDVETRLKVAE